MSAGLFLVITNFIVAIFILREKDAVYVTNSVGIFLFDELWQYNHVIHFDLRKFMMAILWWNKQKNNAKCAEWECIIAYTEQ